MTEFEIELLDKIDTLTERLSNQPSQAWVTLWAVLAGVGVYIISEIIRSKITVHTDYQKLKEEIIFVLIAYADVIHNSIPYEAKNFKPNPRYEEASEKIRSCAAKLRIFCGRNIFPRCNIPEKEILREVSRDLIGLSNGVYAPKQLLDRYLKDNDRREANICEKLKIELR